MSQGNVEIVQRTSDHFRRTGEPLWEVWDPQVVWDMSTFTGWPEKQTYHGREGYTEFMDSWLSTWDEWEWESVELIDAGDEVVQIARQRGKGAGAGVSVEMSYAQVWTLRDGNIVRVRPYASKAEALEAVGLRE
jgi:ketosteroid isomerase-like protein